jgi:hypothetical protein
METFFWSIILAAISALSFVAYKHPVAFKNNIAYPLLAFDVLALIGILAKYLGGMGVLVNNLSKEIADSKIDQNNIEFLSNSIKSDYDFLVFALGITIAIFVYLVLLINLPKILSLKE